MVHKIQYEHWQVVDNNNILDICQKFWILNFSKCFLFPFNVLVPTIVNYILKMFTNHLETHMSNIGQVFNKWCNCYWSTI